MKKAIMILVTTAAITAMSCGDGRTARERENEELEDTELAEPDTTTMENDTTSTPDVNDRDDGVEEAETEGRSERDTIQ